MARKKHSLKHFGKVSIQSKDLKNIKGGHKAIPAGPGSSGSFIWEGVDVRENNLLSKRVAGISSLNGTIL
ncbi:MAG: hypothetical protein MI974_03360 [Chitinophagales bacterium]|nr:hypothetical protein [Chitinophagales bacterium]